MHCNILPTIGHKVMACENLKNRSRFLLRGVAIFLTVISAVKVSATRHGAAYSVLSKR